MTRRRRRRPPGPTVAVAMGVSSEDGSVPAAPIHSDILLTLMLELLPARRRGRRRRRAARVRRGRPRRRARARGGRGNF